MTGCAALLPRAATGGGPAPLLACSTTCSHESGIPGGGVLSPASLVRHAVSEGAGSVKQRRVSGQAGRGDGGGGWGCERTGQDSSARYDIRLSNTWI
ncbi:hypothetical protein BDA96_02G193400 [Sorghum bicolor]|uniref:Uncharacterized protein n=2 Tax=Sorghum bicolor TaxID=4558 RepID=A0A921RPI2_SORBI|nr:hypothetical protein BDA96_02G193400 [Sorghum bicolor]OQU89395.1 hypothetical protein SORBI_3002G182850 [Sorghum bicolor]